MASEPISVKVAIVRINALQDLLEQCRQRCAEGKIVGAQEEALKIQAKVGELLVWLGCAEGQSRQQHDF